MYISAGFVGILSGIILINISRRRENFPTNPVKMARIRLDFGDSRIEKVMNQTWNVIRNWLEKPQMMYLPYAFKYCFIECNKNKRRFTGVKNLL